MSFSNTWATLPGIVGQTVTGHVLSATSSFSIVFLIGAVVWFVGGVVFLLFAEAHNVFDGGAGGDSGGGGSMAFALKPGVVAPGRAKKAAVVSLDLVTTGTQSINDDPWSAVITSNCDTSDIDQSPAAVGRSHAVTSVTRLLLHKPI